MNVAPGTRHSGAISRPSSAGQSALALKHVPWRIGDRSRPRNPKGVAPFLLIVMACSFFYINISGQIYPAEIVLAGYVLHRALSGNSGRIQVPSWIVLTLVAWTVGSMLSDYVAQAEFIQLVRGLARTFFVLTDLAALWLLVDRDRKFITMAWLGFCLSSLLSFFL